MVSVPHSWLCCSGTHGEAEQHMLGTLLYLMLYLIARKQRYRKKLEIGYTQWPTPSDLLQKSFLINVTSWRCKYVGDLSYSHHGIVSWRH